MAVTPHGYDDRRTMKGLSMPALDVSVDRLVDAIQRSWSHDTSNEPDRWSSTEPARGQCAVTALVVQDILGGELRRAGDGAGVSHYWNEVDGRSIDLTVSQFPLLPAWLAQSEPVERDYVLAWPDTWRRYTILHRRIADTLG